MNLCLIWFISIQYYASNMVSKTMFFLQELEVYCIQESSDIVCCIDE